MLSSPADVAVDLEGRILIADRGNNVVQIYTKEGKHLLKFPSEKTSLGGIWSLTVSADGSIIVADYANHEVKVYSGDGKLKFSFGENGKGDGQFDHPINVAIDQEGNIIVVDNLNARVHVWG